MWSTIKKAILRPSVLGFGLLIVFAVAALGCGSGMMSPMSAMHGNDVDCSSMFTNEFVISHKDLGSGLALVLLVVSLFFISTWAVSRVSQLAFSESIDHRLLKARNTLRRLDDHTLQQFSSGILHPQIY